MARHNTSQLVSRSRRVSHNLLLDLPITWRLTLGFLAAALVAVLAAGLTGSQRTQSLSRQSDFYQHLLQINTSLNIGNNYLILMDTKLHQMQSDASAPTPSGETLHTDQSAIQTLATLYDTVLTNYARNDLLNEHPNQVSLLNEGGHASLIAQQQSLVGSTLRAWHVYRAAQNIVLQDFLARSLSDANSLLRAQAEPTNADAQSALRALIHLDQHLSSSVRDAASVEEQNQTITTLVAALCAFLIIALIGWLISKTLIQRLRQLRRVTQAVERGQLDTRVQVAGHDEIADVSASVNNMLDTIVGLLEETGRQRDALSNAAAHLFSEMRVVSAGDLRVHAPVSDDPIGMLANAFNFTVGRFNRFVLQTQMTVEQLDLLAQQQMKHIDGFKSTLTTRFQVAEATTGPLFSSISPSPSASKPAYAGSYSRPQAPNVEGMTQVMLLARHSRNQLLHLTQESSQQLRVLQSLTMRLSQSTSRMQQFIRQGSSMSNEGSQDSRAFTKNRSHMQEKELQLLEASLVKLDAGWKQFQEGIAKELSGLDATLKSLASVSTHAGEAETGSGETTMHSQDFVPHIQGFTQEMLVTTRHLLNITQDIRKSAAQFRLDAAASNTTRPVDSQRREAMAFLRRQS